MGIARGAAALILEETKRQPFAGMIATLGRQSMYLSSDELERQFKKFDVAPACSIDVGEADITDEVLFSSLGFDAVESLDYSDFEDATHIVDLNADALPPDLVGKFDSVLDSGTLEHVFHIPNAMKNIVSLLKVGGRVMFLSPSSNHVDHGFFMFSPTFFSDYFAANGFRIETMYLVRYSGDLDVMWEAYHYDGNWRDLHIGGVDDQPYAVWVVATKLDTSTCDVIPQQGYYADNNPAYAGSNLAGEPSGAGLDSSGLPYAPRQTESSGSVGLSDQSVVGLSVVSALKTIIRRIPFAVRTFRLLKRLFYAIRCSSEKRGVQSSAHGIFRKPLVGRY